MAQKLNEKRRLFKNHRRFEPGYRWSTPAITLDLSTRVSHVSTKIDGFAAEGINYDFKRHSDLRGQLAARAQLPGQLGPFVGAKILHEFGEGARVTLSSGLEADAVKTGGRGTWARLEAGIEVAKAGLQLSAWADVGDTKGIGLGGGVRF